MIQANAKVQVAILYLFPETDHMNPAMYLEIPELALLALQGFEEELRILHQSMHED